MFRFFKKRVRVFKHELYNSDFDLEKIYEMPDGRSVYAFSNLLQIPYKRKEAAMMYSRFAQLCMTPERFQEYVKQAIAALNKNNTALAATLLYHMQITDEIYGEVESLLRLASVFTVMEGEDAEKYTESMQEKKVELWKSIPDARAFFLTWAAQSLPNLSQQQRDNILKNIKENQPADQLLKQTHLHISQTLQNGKTKS